MRKFFKAFDYAWSGILYGLKSERNLKSHLLTAVVVCIGGIWTGLSVTEWFVVLILIGGMLSLEMMNSAIECVVDLITTESNPLAKHAKDLAAGAVLVFAIISAGIGFLIFVPKWLN